MTNRKKRLKERRTTARNDRRAVYKYYPVNEHKSVAVLGGRCHTCNKITNDFCLSCTRFVCGKHSKRKKGEIYCTECEEDAQKTRFSGTDFVGNKRGIDYVG